MTCFEGLDGYHFVRAVLSTDLLSQGAYGRRPEYGAYRQVGVQAGVDRGDQPRRQERIPTEVEEGVVDPDPPPAPAPRRRSWRRSARSRFDGAR